MTRAGPLAGQVCLVTGASRGIGFYTARELARQGARVILVGHHAGRGQDAQARIREAAGLQTEARPGYDYAESVLIRDPDGNGVEIMRIRRRLE